MLLAAFAMLSGFTFAIAEEKPEPPRWKYSEEIMRPFWEGDTVEGESVLFIKDPETGEAKASLLFPVTKIVSVFSCSGWRWAEGAAYEEGRDFVWNPGSREITLPANSRVFSATSDQLRRPAGSQKYKLTHRDGNGEIFFGGSTEYHAMQTCITYQHEPEAWPTPVPAFDEKSLPRTTQKLRAGEPVSIVLIGDSISTGCNTSGWGETTPWQPPFQDLLLEHLEAKYASKITFTNDAVGGTSTPWGLTRITDIVESHPDLVIVAFGMNDASGIPATEYQANTKAIIAKIRGQLAHAEFILVASMLANPNWTTLNHQVFPQYRDALAELVEPGVALADMTSIWTEFHKRKQDWDLTGNGVNHPNDFGHRVYAQVLSTLLVSAVAPKAPATTLSEPLVMPLWDINAPNGDGTFEESDAKITVHQAENGNGTTIVICPGGGYGGLVTGGEGHGIAKWLNGHGITGVVLEYRLPKGRSFVPLLDAQRAIRTVRANAKQWDIDPAKVGIMGFSAGGHLASTAATHFDDGDPKADEVIQRQSSRPDFAILVYPVVTMGEKTHGGSRNNLLGPNPSPELIDLFSNEKQVTDKTPPIFLAHALDDKPVPPQNSKALFDALQAKNIPSKYLELPSGGHGLNGYKGPMWDAWQQQSLEWLATLKFIPSK